VNILLVEDDPDELFTLAQLLTQRGHVVHSAATVETAKTLLATEPLDLVLLDIHLGTEAMGGLEVARAAKFASAGGRAAWRSIPIFVLSGTEPTDVRVAARTNALEGVRFWFGKPLDIERLDQAIAGVAGITLPERTQDRHKCPACGRMTRNTTAGCDYCDLDDK
jgi:CheY-like chemotaxis protein